MPTNKKTAAKAAAETVPALPAAPRLRRGRIFNVTPESAAPPAPSAPPAPVVAPLPVTSTGLTAAAVEAVLSARAARKRVSKAQKATLDLRKELWPDIAEDRLWSRKSSVGFTTVPRTMPLFMELIAEASKRVSTGAKSVPAGRAYFVLWCRVFDEAVVKIEVEAAAAAEAGYAGERNITTWREHMRVLQELGFIDAKAGVAGPHQFILLLNPYHAARKLREKRWVQDATWMALFQRALDIGATDLTA